MDTNRLRKLAGVPLVENHMGGDSESGTTNPRDTIALDVPTFIRVLEWAREDVKSDLQLHKATENAVRLCSSGRILTMEQYDDIIRGTEQPEMEQNPEQSDQQSGNEEQY